MILHKRMFITLFLAGILFISGCSTKTNWQDAYDNKQKNIQSQVVRTAAKQIGRPYRLGGTTPKSGFDCSGLIYWAYKQHGIQVPRVTTQQAKAGKFVPKNTLRPGDILVFKSRSAPNGLHTGIYMGNNKFLHSPNSKSKVKTEELKGSYWGKQYMHARRIVGGVYARK